MAILINDNYSLQAENKAFDARYLDINVPWADCAAAIAGIPTYRYPGLTINISNVEWWWKDGIDDSDLEQKTLGGSSNLTGATNGLCLTSSGTTVVLGGTLTGDTTISGDSNCLSFGHSSSFLDTTSFLTKSFSVSGDGLFNKLTMSGQMGCEAGSFCAIASNTGVTNTGSISITTDDIELPRVVIGLGAAGGLTNEIKMCGDYYRQEVGGYTGNSATFVHCICTENLSTNAVNYWELYETGDSSNDISYNGSLVDKVHCFGINNQNILLICSGGTARYGVATSAACITNDADLTNKIYVDSCVSGVSNTIDVCNVYAEYSATTENDFIGVSGASTVYLPAVPKACQRITVADIEGDALSSNIIICGCWGANGQNINGEGNATINTNYGSMTFVNNNVNGWTAVAFIN